MWVEKDMKAKKVLWHIWGILLPLLNFPYSHNISLYIYTRTYVVTLRFPLILLLLLHDDLRFLISYFVGLPETYSNEDFYWIFKRKSFSFSSFFEPLAFHMNETLRCQHIVDMEGKFVD